MIGIIGAMDKELHLYFHNMTIERTDIIADKTFYIGKIRNHKVVVVKSGIGKVNASITTAILLLNYKCRLVLNTGIAGGISPTEIGDILIADGVAYFDASVNGIEDMPYGQIPGDPLIVNVNSHHLELAKNTFENLNYSYKIGTLVSGDKFVTRIKDIRKIQKNVKNILGVEMEGMAIALTALKFNVPFISIRGVSDVIGSKNQTADYDLESTNIANKTTNFVFKFLEAFNE